MENITNKDEAKAYLQKVADHQRMSVAKFKVKHKTLRFEPDIDTIVTALGVAGIVRDDE